MKRINYLIVAMLMAFTMVGCQFDPTYLENKISGLEESDGKQNERLDGLEKRVATIEGKLEGIDFSKFLKEGDLKGYVKVDDTEVLETITKAVKDALKDDLTGYTKSEIDAKLKAITDITDKLGEVYETIENVAELSTKVTSLETTVATLSGKVTALENKPAPSGNGGDGYCGLSASEVEKIKVILQKYVNGKLEASILNLTNYALTTDLVNYVETTTLNDYYSKTDLDKIIDNDTTTTFSEDLATIVGRISKVENLLKVNGELATSFADLVKDKVDNTDTIKNLISWYNDYNEKLANLDLETYLADYLTVANAENTYATKSSVETVASSLASLDTRVKALEDVLEIKTNTKTITNRIALATSGLVTNDTFNELKNSFDTLNATVTNETDGLVKQIGNATSDINTIENRVATLEGATWTFSEYSEAIINGLAETYALKNDIPNMNDYAKKTEVVGLVETYIGQEMGKATSDLKSIFNNVYATNDELASKLDASAIDIENITSRLATLESDKTKVEFCPNRYSSYSSNYLYYPYIKFTDNNGKVCYMTILDVPSIYTIDDLDFNSVIDIEKSKSEVIFEIKVVNSIPSKYSPNNN